MSTITPSISQKQRRTRRQGGLAFSLSNCTHFEHRCPNEADVSPHQASICSESKRTMIIGDAGGADSRTPLSASRQSINLLLHLILNHPISNPNLCKHILRFCWILLQFPSNMCHIHAQNTVIIVRIRPPDIRNNRIIRHDPAGILCQQGDNLNSICVRWTSFPSTDTRCFSKSIVSPFAWNGRL